MFALLLLAVSMNLTDGCFATSPSTTPTTTTTTAAPTGCKTCAQNLIMLTTVGGGSHAFQSDVTDTSGACAVRTLTCAGGNANIEINNGDGVIMDGDDGAVDMLAHLQVTCNAAGTGWLYMGVVITQAECASA